VRIWISSTSTSKHIVFNLSICQSLALSFKYKYVKNIRTYHKTEIFEQVSLNWLPNCPQLHFKESDKWLKLHTSCDYTEKKPIVLFLYNAMRTTKGGDLSALSRFTSFLRSRRIWKSVRAHAQALQALKTFLSMFPKLWESMIIIFKNSIEIVLKYA
jgi:hypothetical protein